MISFAPSRLRGNRLFLERIGINAGHRIGNDRGAAFALVANGDPYSFAGGRPLRLAPEARFELGLDLVAPRRVRPAGIPRLLRYAFNGGGEHAEDVLYGHDLDRIEVRSDRPLPLHVDGEDLGDVEAVVFEAERDAVWVLAPEAGTLNG